MKNYLSACVCALLVLAGNVRAQSLEAVLSSIQERKLALEQRSLAQWEMRGSPTVPAQPTTNLIDWDGAGDYPAEGALASASIETRVKILNQAVYEFDLLKKNYVNISQTHLDGTQTQAKIKRGMGQLVHFNEWSLPTVGRVTPSNYHLALRKLAQDIDKLRVLSWPFVQHSSELVSPAEINNQQLSQTIFTVTPPATGTTLIIGQSSLEDAASPAYDGHPWEMISCSGTSHEEKTSSNPETWEGRQQEGHQGKLTKQFDVTIKGNNGTLDGKFYIVSREKYNPATEVKLNGTLVATDGGWVVEHDKDGDGTYTRPAMTFTVKGQWKADSVPDDGNIRNRHYFEVNGHVLSGNPGVSHFFLNGGGVNSSVVESRDPVVYSRQNAVLVVPEFEKGLDTTAMQAALGILKNLPEGHAFRGLFVRNSGKTKLLIGLGAGKDDNSRGGIVGIVQHPENSWGRWSGYQAPSQRIEISDTWMEDETEQEAESIAHWSQLTFMGPSEDFEVLYEARRGTSERETLNQWTGSLMDRKHGRATFGHHIMAWDRPRLRQVVGKDMLLDVQYQAGTKNGYKYQINLYWLPTAGAPDHDITNGFIPTTGLALYKGFNISNPTVNLQGFPTDPHQMVVEELDGTNTISSATYSGTVTSEGIVTDYSLDLKDGTDTLYAETWNRAEVNGTIQVTVQPTQDDVAAAPTVTTYPLGTNPLSVYARPTQVKTGSGASAVTTVFDYPGYSTPASWGTRWPKKITTTDPFGPNAYMEWLTSGIPKQSIQGSWTTAGEILTPTSGSWSTDWSLESGLLKAISKHGTSTYTTTWTEWNSGATQIKTYSAPDGKITSKTAPANRITTVDLYPPTETTNIPWAVKQVTNRDGTGSTHSYNLTADGSLTVETKSGLVSGNSVTKGINTTRSTNARGYPTSVNSHSFTSIPLSQLQLSGTTYENFTTWGAPRKSKSYRKKSATSTDSFEASWAYQTNGNRLDNYTDPSGVITDTYTYDALDRTTGYKWDGKQGSIKYNKNGPGSNERGISHMLDFGAGLGNRGFTQSWGLTGDITGGTSESGVSSNYGVIDNGDDRTISGSNGFGETFNRIIREADGSMVSSSGNTALKMKGKALVPEDQTVDGKTMKLFKRTQQLDIQSGDDSNDRTVWTDAWGRIHKSEVPGADGTPSATEYIYSNPASLLRRVIVRGPKPAGHANHPQNISEQEPYSGNDAVSRSGVDVNCDGLLTLAGGDIFTESTTKIEGSVIKTTTKATGENEAGVAELRTIDISTYNPKTGVSNSTLNEGEATADQSEDATGAAPVRLVTTDRGDHLLQTLDKHGRVVEESTAGSVGQPKIIREMTYYDDGALKKIIVSNDGIADEQGDFVLEWDPNGLIKEDSLKLANGRSPGIAQSRAAGTDSMEVDGATSSVEVDAANNKVTTRKAGDGVWDKTSTTEVDVNGQTETIAPDDGADTIRQSNPSGVQTAHTFDSGHNPVYTWLKGHLLDSISLGRGQNQKIQFTYFDDGAKQLHTIQYPALVAGASSLTETFNWTQAGLPSYIKDESGERNITYWRDRTRKTDYTSGTLDLAQVEREYDASTGNQNKLIVRWDGADVLTLGYDYTPAGTRDSGELAGIKLDATQVVTYTRDPASRLVTKWDRPFADVDFSRDFTKGGRITEVSNNTPESPGFKYDDPQAFDTKGRRKTVICSRGGQAYGTWSYTYDDDAQLTSANNSKFSNFKYVLDGIGRRQEYEIPDTANTYTVGSNALNQPTAWDYFQHYNLLIDSVPGAKLYLYNGTGYDLLTDQGGPYLHTQPVYGAGGWVNWKVLGVLEGQGDPGAGPDAKSELSGWVWVNPPSSTYDYDEDGNRENAPGWTYVWDGRNSLFEAKTADYDTAAQGKTLSFKYDAEGRRVYKKITTKTTVNGETQTSDKHCYFVWDGWDLVYERHQTGEQAGLILERKYIWGLDISSSHFGAGGAGGLVAIIEKIDNQTEKYYPLYDGTGHVVGLADSEGDLVAEYWWGPFGELIESRGEKSDSNPFRYATKYFDVETGLYYFGHRYYDPVTGHWLNREPLGEDESLNLYAYCSNDPINKVDRLGLDDVWVGDMGVVYFQVENWIGREGAFNRLLKGPLEKKSKKDIRIGVLGVDGKVDLDDWVGGKNRSVSIADFASIAGEKGTWNPGNFKRDKLYYHKVIQRVYASNWKPIGKPGDLLAGAVDQVFAPVTAAANVFSGGGAHTLSGALKRDGFVNFNANTFSYHAGGEFTEAAEYATLFWGVGKHAANRSLSWVDNAAGQVSYPMVALPPRGVDDLAALASRHASNAAHVGRQANKRTGAGAALVFPNGNIYTGVSGVVSREALHPSVQKILGGLETYAVKNGGLLPNGSKMPGWNGWCAEMQCISDAMYAGEKLSNGVMRASWISAQKGTGAVRAPCASCDLFAELFGIR